MKDFEINFDVLFVGAGIASLSAAYHLKQLVNKHNQKNPDKKLDSPTIGIFEKSQSVGDHVLSGTVIEPGVLDEFMPDWKDSDIPIKAKVSKDNMYFLTSKGGFRFPLSPPGMSNQGNYVLSLTELTKWLGKKCEAEQIEIYTSEPVKDIICSSANGGEEGKVVGIKTGEKGLDKEGNKKSNYLPGAEVGAKVLVVGEGSYGFITKKLVDKFNLNDGCNPQSHATGVKELWEVKPENFSVGTVTHTFGFPLDFHTYGGGFVYHIRDNLVAVGLAVGLDYQNPRLNLQEELQKFKTNPLISKILKGGKLVEYGAKTLSEGGYYSIGKLSGPGFMLIGEGAGLLNSKKLKGIHIAIKSGMLAAETIFEALKTGNLAKTQTSEYDKKTKDSWINEELYSARNFHQGFQNGVISGMLHTAFQTISGGRGLIDRFQISEDYLHLKKLSEYPEKADHFKPDDKITFDRLTEVYFSGVKHEEDQPCHLKIKDLSICTGKCVEEFGNPCTLFCPAQVYEIVEEDGKKKLEINFSNCLHCKTCEIKDPYNLIEWTTPEGGGGPNYKEM